MFGAMIWLRSPYTARIVVGHGNMGYENLMYRGKPLKKHRCTYHTCYRIKIRKHPTKLVCLDFETTRMMPGAMDLGSLLVAADSDGMSLRPIGLPLENRQAMAAAYKEVAEGDAIPAEQPTKDARRGKKKKVVVEEPEVSAEDQARLQDVLSSLTSRSAWRLFAP